MKGNNLLYTHATTDGKYKYYIANSNDTLNTIDGNGSKINARDPDEWMLTKMREAISRVDNELGLSFEEVTVRSEANLIINVRTELNSDYATTVNPGSVADFLLKTADEIIFELNITIPYDYSGNEPTIISNPDNNDKQGFTNRFLHELGHVMTKSIGHKKEFWENFKFLLEFKKLVNFLTLSSLFKGAINILF